MPVSVLGSELAPRYLYAGLPFVCLLWVGAFQRFGRETLGGRVLRGMAVLIWLPFLAAYAWSPSVTNQARLAAEVETFADAVKQESAHWAAGDRVLILDLPHPGDPSDQWVYSQLLLNILLPEKPVHLTVNPADMAADWRYRWEDGALVAFDLGEEARISQALVSESALGW